MVGGLFRVIASRVECTPCEESTQAWHDTEELAVAAWNRRTPPPSVDWAEVGPELVRLVAGLLPFVEFMEDRGPSGEGWQSKKLESLIASSRTAIARAALEGSDHAG